VSLILALRKLR
jgi:hypothetical protein